MKVISFSILFIFLYLVQPISSLKACINDDDCPDLYLCESDFCSHKGLIPITMAEIVGLLVLGLIVGISNSGGTAGTPFMIPLLLYFFNFTLKESIMCCYFLVLGGCLGNYFKFSQLRNKENGGPLINYNIVMLSLPMTAIGSLIGNFFNLILPNFIICGIMMFFLFYSYVKLWRRLRKELNKEKEISDNDAKVEIMKFENDKSSSTPNDDITPKEVLKDDTIHDLPEEESNSNNIKDLEMKEDSPLEIELAEVNEDIDSKNLKIDNQKTLFLENDDESIRLLIQREQTRYPMQKLKILLTILLVNTVISLLRGSHKFPSILNIGYCSKEYWLFIPVDGLINIGIFLLVFRKISSETQILESLPNPIKFDNLDKMDMLLIGGMGLCAGFFSGLLGFGAGIVLTTFLLGRNISPMAATATTIVVVIFTAAISTVQVFIHGHVDNFQMLVFFIIAFFSSMAVGCIINYFIEVSHKESILLVILVIKTTISFVVVPYLTIVKIFEFEEGFFEFNLC